MAFGERNAELLVDVMEKVLRERVYEKVTAKVLILAPTPIDHRFFYILHPRNIDPTLCE